MSSDQHRHHQDQPQAQPVPAVVAGLVELSHRFGLRPPTPVRHDNNPYYNCIAQFHAAEERTAAIERSKRIATGYANSNTGVDAPATNRAPSVGPDRDNVRTPLLTSEKPSSSNKARRTRRTGSAIAHDRDRRAGPPERGIIPFGVLDSDKEELRGFSSGRH